MCRLLSRSVYSASQRPAWPCAGEEGGRLERSTWSTPSARLLSCRAFERRCGSAAQARRFSTGWQRGCRYESLFLVSASPCHCRSCVVSKSGSGHSEREQECRVLEGGQGGERAQRTVLEGPPKPCNECESEGMTRTTFGDYTPLEVARCAGKKTEREKTRASGAKACRGHPLGRTERERREAWSR